ncbi:MAG TPA: PucR family transcriptional regulator ligand-binding domain-containing protein [Actinomycetota bacterium]|nr:PucR family transcriptional regulator ligand-binding domain-containing protein [Actinomycetota bacterium]
MSVTIRDLVEIEDLRLTVVGGAAGLDTPIRWVHTSELNDPTPWLTGGELLLTTGMGLAGPPAQQRSFIRRLVKAELAGLGFGLGFGFDEVPDALVRAADREGFPVVAVPFPVPFIAIAEAVSSRLSEERIREARLSVEIHESLAALVSEGAGLADVLDEITRLAGGWALLFDLRGHVVAKSSADADPPDPVRVWGGLPRGLTERHGPLTSSEVGPHETMVGLAVTAGKRHEGVLVFGKKPRLDTRDRIVVRHAVTVLGLLLASKRAVLEAERRVAGDILSEAFSGRLTGPALRRRLELVGFEPGASLTALVMEAPEDADADALDDLAWALDGALGSRVGAVRTASSGGRVTALISHPDPEAIAEAVLSEVAEAAPDLGLDGLALRIGVGESAAADAIRRSYLSAVMALRAAGPGRRLASPRDLGSYGLLLGGQPRPVLEGFVRSVLGPLVDRDNRKSSELVASVRAFIEAGGRWEPGADVLGVHRHTLRYRVRQAEELLGRDLSSAEDRLEVWLALKASDLLGE